MRPQQVDRRLPQRPLPLVVCLTASMMGCHHNIVRIEVGKVGGSVVAGMSVEDYCSLAAKAKDPQALQLCDAMKAAEERPK